MKKTNVPNLKELDIPVLQESAASAPVFAGYRTQTETHEDIEAILSTDPEYAQFSRDSLIDDLAVTINLRKKLLAEVHTFKLDLDFKKQARRVSDERWEAKKGFFDALGKLGKTLEKRFISPAAAMFRAQQEMIDQDEKRLRKQFEMEIEGLQDKLEAVEAYLATADTDALAEGMAKFGDAKAFIIDMKSNPKSPHYQEINDINKYFIQLAINRFNGNGMQNAVGVYETTELRRVAKNDDVKKELVPNVDYRGAALEDADDSEEFLQVGKPVRKPIKGLAGLRESEKIQKELNNGLSSAEANMADIAANSFYVRNFLAGDKKASTSRPEWLSTKLNPMDDVYVTYDPKTGEAVMASELTEAQDLTSIGTHNYIALQKAARKETAKRWIGNGLKAAFAAGMLLLAGKGIVGDSKKVNQTDSEAIASATASANPGPAASGVALSKPSATAPKIETPVAEPSAPVKPAPAAEPSTSGQPAPKLDKVAKRPTQSAQNPQKAKISTLPKSNPILEGEAKKAPEAKKPPIAKASQKPAVEKHDEPKKDSEQAEKPELLSQADKDKALDAIIAKITSFQARMAAIDKETTGNGKFFNVVPDMVKIPGELDVVWVKTKALQTNSDKESINTLLGIIDTQLSGIERTIAIQRLAKIHGNTEFDAKVSLAFIDETIAKLGGKSHKFGIRKVTSATKNAKDSSETVSIMSVDLDAAKAALKRIVERTSDINQSEAEANKDRETAKTWLAHITYVKFCVEKKQGISE